MTANTAVDPSWYRASAHLTEIVNQFAGRDDLIARIMPRDDASPAAAWFTPSLAAVDVDPKKSLIPDDISPEDIRLNTPRARRAFPVLAGVVGHEAAHAAHTVLKFPKDATKAQIYWATILEEPRIETRAVRISNPMIAPYLRMSTKQVVMSDNNTFSSDDGTVLPAAYVRAAILILGRVAGGVLYESDAENLRRAFVNRLGEDALNTLNAIIEDLLVCDDGNIESMLALSDRVIALLEESSSEEEQNQQDNAVDKMDGGETQSGDSVPSSMRMPCGASSHDDSENNDEDSDENQDHDAEQPTGSTSGNVSTPKDSDSSGSDTTKDAASGDGEDAGTEESDSETSDTSSESSTAEDDELDDAMRETVQRAQQGASRDLDAEMDAGRISEDNTRQRQNAERSRAQRTSVSVFGGTSGGSGPTVRSVAPTSADMEQQRILTTSLRRAQFREMSRTEVSTSTPPGRMRVSEVVRRNAQVAMRTQITAKPWTQTHRRLNDAPPIVLGVSIDASSSMSAWQKPASSLAWAISQSMRHLNGRVASVAWNVTSKPLIAPGTAQNRIPVATATGGSTGCPESLRALEGALQLHSDNDGIKIVVVVTDSELPSSGDPTQDVNRLVRNGVHVIWVNVSRGSRSSKVLPAKAHHVDLADPSQYGAVLGQKIIEIARSVNH